MSASSTVNITINGQPILARAGQTVYEAAEGAGIYIPTLCHHPKLKYEGACRICLVEIEKQRALEPACTFPVSDGMVVHTQTDKVNESRRSSLHMIFSERSHYCMYCPVSGSGATTDCELQQLAYRHGLDCWLYPPDFRKAWPLDASRKYFVMDHARCILCRRCVRACNEISANHTLGVHQRGTRSMIGADDDVPFGESTCVSCGTCLQVCPTGALHDRHSAYCGHETSVTRTRATCFGCAVGCGIQAITRDNQLLRVEGDWDAGNGGLLCAVGRFEVLEPKQPRLLHPLVRVNGRQIATSWEEALDMSAMLIRDARSMAGLISPRMTTETLASFACFFHEVVDSAKVALLYGEVPPLDLGASASLVDVPAADCIIVIHGDPQRHQKVAWHLIRRGIDHQAKIIIVNDTVTALDPYASLLLDIDQIAFHAKSPFERLRTTYHLRASGILELKKTVEAAKRPVLFYGAGLSSTVYAALRTLPSHVRFLPLIKGTNAAGAARLGLDTRPVDGDGLLVLLGDDMPDGQPLPPSDSLVIQAAYASPWTEAAQVVLPAPLWFEQEGRMINMEGKTLQVAPLLQPPDSIPSYWLTLLELARRLGKTLSPEEIAHISGPNNDPLKSHGHN
jgi:formate dehydrogenase major subunit